VPNFKLASVSSLEALKPLTLQRAGRQAGVILQERSDVSLLSVLARKNAGNQFGERVRQEFDLELPEIARCETNGAVSFIWAGPKQWLVMADGAEGVVLRQRLRSALAEVASIVDQSDARSVVRISGPHAREALAKGLHIDLHPDVFRPGDTAITVISYINVHFWQLDEAPIYEFAIDRSFAVAFCEWLADSAAEYGFALS
jgi:heterotetrameric sarcosine oxidase gamma subunit